MSQDVTAIKSVLDPAKEILILLPQNPGPDSIASSLGLYRAIRNSGKQVHIACGTPIDFSQYPLRQSEQISQKIGNKNLVISLKVTDRDSIDKVSYNLDEAGKVFNLIISPKKGASPLQSDAVSYSLAGARADLIIIVGASAFDDLGSLYAAEPSLFLETPTVAINRLDTNSYANHHLSNPKASSIAEFMVSIISSLGLALDPDIATNLLAAIDVVTDKLTLSNASATTFEAIANLLRAGGIRIMLTQMQPPESKQMEAKPEVNTVSSTPTEVPKDWLSPKILKAN